MDYPINFNSLSLAVDTLYVDLCIVVSVLGSEVKLLLAIMEPILLHAVKFLSGDNTHITLVLISRSSDKIRTLNLITILKTITWA